MTDGVHIRLMITRGRKTTPNQGPRFAIGKPTMVIIAEVQDAAAGSLGAAIIALHLGDPLQRASMCFDLRLNSPSRPGT